MSQVIIDAQDKVIAEQGGQISDMAKDMMVMKQMLVKAGLVPPLESCQDVGVDMEKKSKKRLPVLSLFLLMVVRP